MFMAMASSNQPMGLEIFENTPLNLGVALLHRNYFLDVLNITA